MEYKEHALVEFKEAGYNIDDDLNILEPEGDPNRWIIEGTLELLDVFGKQGHSGMSAPYAISIFEKLASFKPLTPLTGEDWEWEDVSEFFQESMLQNKRFSSVFKKPGGLITNSQAIVWQGPDEYDTFTGSGFEGISSSLEIKKFPFYPKTFYIDLIKIPYDPKIHKDNYEDKEGNKFTYKIKDYSQLEPVWELYVDPRE